MIVSISHHPVRLIHGEATLKGVRMPQEKSFRSEAAVVATGLATGDKRCAWTGTDPLFVAYHDEEWSVSATRL